MTQNFENSNDDMIHVDAYTRDDGTHVNEYWMRKRGNGGFSNGGFLDEKYSDGIPNGGFAPPNPLGRIDAPYNYQFGGIVPPYLQNNGGIVERNNTFDNYNPLLSYLPTDNLGQNQYNYTSPNPYNNILEGGVTWTHEDEINRNYEEYLHNKYGKLKWNDSFMKSIYVDSPNIISLPNYGKKSTELTQNATDNFINARKDPNATIFENTYEIPNANIRKFLSTDDRVTDNGRINIDSMRGAHYNSQSGVAQSVAHDKSIKDYCFKNYNVLVENGKKIKEADSKLWNGGEKYFGNAQVASDSIQLDEFWHNKSDLNKVTLYNPHVTEDGHFKTTVVDVLDYTYLDKKDKTNVLLKNANNWAYRMQENGKLENIYHIIDIDIPVSDLK